MRRKSESMSAAKREAHDRADAAMPDVAGLTVKQAEMALAEARNRERERREYERRKAKGKPLSKITQDAIRYEKCFESGVVKVEKGLYSITCDVDNMDYRNLGESEKKALYVRLLRVYNLFEPTTHLQWSVIVRVVGRRSILDEVLISHQPDGLDRLRDEVNEVLTMADERMYEQKRRLHIGRAGNKHTHRKVSLQRRMQAVAALQNRQRRGSKRLRRQEGSRRTAVCIIERRFAAQKRLQNLVSQPNEIHIRAGLLLPVRAARSKR